MYSNSLRLHARHETIGTVSRAMCAKVKVEKCLFPAVTVLGGFSLLGSPQVNNEEMLQRFLFEINIHTVVNRSIVSVFI